MAIGFGGGFLAARLLPSPAHTASPLSTGFAWPFFGKPRAANAPRAGAPKPDGFAIWTTRIDTSRADPLACVRMSRPLDPRRSYSDFVLVSPALEHPVAAIVHGDELCVPGLGFTGHQLTLLKGLPAQTGETLAENVPVDFAGADKPPFVDFDGKGVILPREEADGIGIDTVNVSRLHIEVLCTSPTATWCASRSPRPTRRRRATTATTAMPTRIAAWSGKATWRSTRPAASGR